MQKELRRTLLKYKLHTDQELFDKAYGYIRRSAERPLFVCPVRAALYRIVRTDTGAGTCQYHSWAQIITRRKLYQLEFRD